MAVLFLSLALSACARWRAIRPQVAADCPLKTPGDAIRSDTVPLRYLTGRLRIVYVDTLNDDEAPDTSFVTLLPPDSAFRSFFVEAFRAATREAPFSRDPIPPPLVNFAPYRPLWIETSKEMSQGKCLFSLCNDEWPTYFRFRYFGGGGVRGIWWNNLSGIGYKLDRRTGRLTHLAGIFCATLVPMEPS